MINKLRVKVYPTNAAISLLLAEANLMGEEFPKGMTSPLADGPLKDLLASLESEAEVLFDIGSELEAAEGCSVTWQHANATDDRAAVFLMLEVDFPELLENSPEGVDAILKLLMFAHEVAQFRSAEVVVGNRSGTLSDAMTATRAAAKERGVSFSTRDQLRAALRGVQPDTEDDAEDAEDEADGVDASFEESPEVAKGAKGPGQVKSKNQWGDLDDSAFKGASSRHGLSEAEEFFLKAAELVWPTAEHLIKDAWRKLARKHHPDTGGNKDVFQRVAEGYEKLVARL